MSLSAGSAAVPAATLPTPAHSVNGGSLVDTHMTDDSPHKRKRSLDDVGDTGHQKKVQIDAKLGIDDLHLDVGEKYLLCRTAHPECLPRTTADLYDIFGLNDLAAEVAREKPNGEKNALRKTYKGHIKRLGVAGHFDVVKKKDGDLSDFMAMIQMPDLEWGVHQVRGRDISDGLSEATRSVLGRAMSMTKGPIPKAVWDASVLGDLASGNGDASKPVSARPSAPNTPSANTPSASTPNPMGRPKSLLPPGHDPLRPKRNIKKRSYGDSSYEGYGEGFPDDDAGADTGYSTGEGEGGAKRRKKVSDSASPPSPGVLSNTDQNHESTSPYPAIRQQSYGPGMIGA
ncbi:Mediator of RNA polymerase II transcription subunit 19 [Drechmeria coniospora]|uniref:Mediator of RNA polymerase II transcription subunit 19 n=1 Tax=Drechmeria coniospora TaxID=98403 RepID=A0A151GWR9_DRECN|nr:Mediator of RNA polymerase II transcription subunit 19 [Drechmeria coniospora]KYK61472.1 Mediator of RNA polymerase II transcription subunit 19 [Drechmeria coniospora]